MPTRAILSTKVKPFLPFLPLFGLRMKQVSRKKRKRELRPLESMVSITGWSLWFARFIVLRRGSWSLGSRRWPSRFEIAREERVLFAPSPSLLVEDKASTWDPHLFLTRTLLTTVVFLAYCVRYNGDEIDDYTVGR